MKLISISLLFIALFIISGCGDKGGTAGGKWVGEVYTSSKTKGSTIIGEFDSYEECIQETQKQARSGIFNCGIQ